MFSYYTSSARFKICYKLDRNDSSYLSLDVISVVLNQGLQTVYRLSPDCQLRYVRNLKFTEPSLCSNEDPLARNSTLVLDQRQQMLMSLHGYIICTLNIK